MALRIDPLSILVEHIETDRDRALQQAVNNAVANVQRELHPALWATACRPGMVPNGVVSHMKAWGGF